MAVIDNLPGFRRRFRITPAQDHVCCELEDDFHCMAVVVHHDGEIATAVEPRMIRVPWTTCPGAVDQLRSTFSGVALAAFAERGGKTANCTHLFDLALLAAAHAHDQGTLVYDILVSDPQDGQRRVELRRNGATLLAWTEASFKIVEPAELAGMPLDKLRPWIDTLDPQRQEAARLLRWGNMLANGRVIPLERQSDATRMPPNCYSFQPQRAAVAKRVGVIRDFSRGEAEPLAGL
ncbi:MAG: DUF2889 domain-containing protein [Pseudomonadota bacterium]|nr:DUF2889 domain-containing protein [Pseudomonadota bacterium]